MRQQEVTGEGSERRAGREPERSQTVISQVIDRLKQTGENAGMRNRQDVEIRQRLLLHWSRLLEAIERRHEKSRQTRCRRNSEATKPR